ncbi:D-sedoheptulose-7-phosphate isomerase [Phytohabitans sp. LJ34]|uniref:D-sedoheptulose-7-phosphate isomerase n=1 Tax=Phytohabitans sp. LJ34 TaxID=3452217 RepID=UPI003F8B5697
MIAGIEGLSLVALASAQRALHAARARGSRVYVAGNGGSASTASHLVCDLTKTAERATERTLRAFALVDNTATLTAYSNDVSYDQALARQVRAHHDPGDILIVISASGNSPNILAAMRSARACGMYTIGLLGPRRAPATALADLALNVESSDAGVIETVHVGVVHALARALREPDSGSTPPCASDGHHVTLTPIGHMSAARGKSRP